MSRSSKRAPWLATVGLVALIAAGCGRAPEATPDQTAPAAPTSAAAAATPTTAPAPAQTAGILVAHCTDANLKLYSFNPTTSAAGPVRDFATSGSKYVPCKSQPDNFRQQFNATLDKLAVTFAGQGGGSHVGYVQANGGLTGLTAAKSGDYGAVTPAQRGAVFNPKTGHLWYYDDKAETRYGWYDPAKPGVPNTGAPLSKYFGLSKPKQFYFSADGSVAVGEMYAPISPDGKIEIYFDPAGGYRLAEPGQPENYSGNYPLLTLAADATAKKCRPYQWVNATTFLCVGDGTTGSPHGVFKMTLSGRSLTQVALLPASEMIVQSATVSPDGTQLAVVARDRATATTALFRTSMNGGGQPVKIADLPFSNQYLSDTQLAAWL